MATATQDDLLVIQDESTAWGDDFSFRFDFDDTLKEEGSTEIWENIPKQSVPQDMSLTSSDFQEDTVMISEEQSPSPENILPEENVILEVENDGEMQREIAEIKTDTQDEAIINIDICDEKEQYVHDKKSTQESENEDLNSILNGTIIKLSSRKKSIADTSAAKMKKVSELKTHIESLEAEVWIIEAEISSLWFESEKIDSNIAQLESMKLDPVKEHNSRRNVKK